MLYSSLGFFERKCSGAKVDRAYHSYECAKIDIIRNVPGSHNSPFLLDYRTSVKQSVKRKEKGPCKISHEP